MSLRIDLATVTADWENLVKQIGLLKINCFDSVFANSFDFQETGNVNEGQKRAVINYRNEETMYVYLYYTYYFVFKIHLSIIYNQKDRYSYFFLFTN